MMFWGYGLENDVAGLVDRLIVIMPCDFWFDFSAFD